MNKAYYEDGSQIGKWDSFMPFDVAVGQLRHVYAVGNGGAVIIMY
jgi:hypothetical protein